MPKSEIKPRVKMGSKGGAWGGLADGERIKNFYEGASVTYRLGNKGLSSAGADVNLADKLHALRSRSRTIIANNPYGETAVTSYVANVIGRGLTAKWPNAKLQTLWDAWCQECDADGLSNLNGLAELVARGEFSDGESLIRKRVRRPQDGLTVPLQIQVIEADYLDAGYNNQTKNILHGIQFDGVGRRTAYHLFKSHPSEQAKSQRDTNKHDKIPVPASDVIHMFRRLRAGQNRGVPKLANIIVRLYEIDEMQDGLLAKQKIAQLFGWIVKRPAPESGDLTQEENTLGSETETGESSTTEDGTMIKKIKSGGIHYLDEGEEVDFSTPDGIGPNYIEWLKNELRVCAKGVGLTYEQFTGDLTGVNYTSIRAGLIEFRRSIEQVQHNLYSFRMYRTIAKWFLQSAVMSGEYGAADYWDNQTKYLPTFKTQGWDHVDPLKDKMADLIDARAGFNSRRNIIDSRGGDYDDIHKELVEDAMADLILDSIPAKTNKAGVLQIIKEVSEAADPNDEQDENERNEDEN